MEKIGNQKIWSFFDKTADSKPAANQTIRAGAGHHVHTYFELARKVAELQFLNRDHVLLFRGQHKDYCTTRGNSTLKARLFRLNGLKRPRAKVLEERFLKLKKAESELVRLYEMKRMLGFERLKRHRILRWAILQHYDVCDTPLLDVTHSLRIAASFASISNSNSKGFIFVLGYRI